MRREIRELQGLQQARLLALEGVQVHSCGSPMPCPKCGAPMHVRKSSNRQGLTLAHGSFRVRETEYFCSAGCTERVEGKDRPVVWRPPEVARLLLPHSSAGYDLLVFVGRRRFLDYRQREEIRGEILAKYGVRLSTGEISNLCKTFCAYLAALHRARSDRLQKLFESDGGWPGHLDATGEDGKGTLLVIYAGWRDLILGAWKIPTERADAILPRIREVASLFGAPRSLMHDLGRAVREASQDYVKGQGGSVVDLVCHMHLVADVGKDLLAGSHDALRSLFRRFKVATRLRAFVRDLGRKLGTDIGEVRQKVKHWFEQEGEAYQLPADGTGMGVVRAMAQWALDYADDGSDKGFPFDRPWLDFYSRCTKLGRAIEAFLGHPHHDNEAYQAIERLFSIVLTVRNQVPFGRQATILANRGKVLDGLRDALRIELKPTGRNERQAVLSPEQAAAQLKDIESALDQFTKSLRDLTPDRGLARDTDAAAQVVLTHLEKYRPFLFGHLIELPPSCGGGIRVADRTNVVLEQMFHHLKGGMRRCSGRKNLGQDLEHLPPEALLARNLRCQHYLEAVCDGSLDQLAAAFSELDAGHRERSLPARQMHDRDASSDIVSSSMPTIDRKLVRDETVSARLQAAARSRAARLG